MKRSRKILAILAMVALPLAALIATPKAGLAEVKKAASVDELAKMYDSSSCKECHKEIYEQWEKSIHSRSLIGSGRTVGGVQGAIKNWMAFEHSGVKAAKDVTVYHWKTTCFKCHLPQIEDATDEVAAQIAEAYMNNDRETLAKVNINCLVCHNKMAVIHQWRDGKPEKNAVYGNSEGPHAHGVYTERKKSATISAAVMCGQCHQGPLIDSPATTQCSTLYGSYFNAYLPAAGGGSKSCQECHMREVDGHAMLSFRDRDYRDPEMVKRALDVEVEAKKGFKSIELPGLSPAAKLVVKITNNAGHRIPDG
jgi:hypothetical protein